jgi:hypothetical protein
MPERLRLSQQKKAQARSPRFAWDGPKSLQIFAVMR